MTLNQVFGGLSFLRLRAVRLFPLRFNVSLAFLMSLMLIFFIVSCRDSASKYTNGSSKPSHDLSSVMLPGAASPILSTLSFDDPVILSTTILSSTDSPCLVRINEKREKIFLALCRKWSGDSISQSIARKLWKRLRDLDVELFQISDFVYT